MMTDIFCDANLHLCDFKTVIRDPVEYTNLTDDILYDIEISTTPELEKARDLIHRIKTRDLYKFVGE